MTRSNNPTRRSFLQAAGTSALCMGVGSVAPVLIPQSVIGKNPPSDKVVIGHIGLGWRGNELMRANIRNPNIQIAALCDLDFNFLYKRLKFLDDLAGADRQYILAEGWDTLPAPSPAGCADPYTDYRYVLERKDIDAVVIAVPDHWHAKAFIDALDAGKDVYGEKPLTLTINQGRKVVRKVKETGRVFQTGMQQRCDPLFRTASEYAMNGRLGTLKRIRILIRGTEVVEPLPDAPVSPGLDWDRWLGPAPCVPYNPRRGHVTFRWFWDYSGGQITDLGTHHADIAQMALGMNYSGPRHIEGFAQTKPGAYEAYTDYDIRLTYDNGVVLSFESKPDFDMIFEGDKGEIFVNRGVIRSTPESILKEPLTSSDKRLPVKEDHAQNWIDCIKTRENPIADVEIGHRSATVCHLANIFGFIQRKLEWDPERELFVNDAEANQYLERPEREPYTA